MKSDSLSLQKIENYLDALNFFSKLELFGIKLGLEQTKTLANFAGNPQDSLRFIHIAGTNGKGTISAMLAAGMESAGYRTGLFTSPHLISPRERIKINGIAISENGFAKFAEKTRKIVAKAAEKGINATYFEANTIMALLYFKEKKTDIVVLECGMGGRLDATNIVHPEAAVITSIGLDHKEHLGKTFAKIAAEKAGIIKKNVPCFCGHNIPPSARAVIKKTAGQNGSKVFFADNPAYLISSGSFSEGVFSGQIMRYKDMDFKINFPGKQQKFNASLVCEILRYLSGKLNFDYKCAIQGLQNAALPARMSIMPDGTIVDGAHNPQAIKVLANNISFYFPKTKFTIIFGCMKDKDAAQMLKQLLRISQKFIFTAVLSGRKAYSPAELNAIFKQFKPQIPSVEASSIAESLRLAKDDKKIVCGSFYLAGELFRQYFSEEKIINWSIK